MKKNDIRITILADNCAGDGLLAEHGFAVWIEADGRRLLFDTGQGTALPTNARTLDIDLGLAENLVLSHGHYDHTGGIEYVLRKNPKIDIYCHPAVVLPRYSVKEQAAKPAGAPAGAVRSLNRLPHSQLHWLSGPEHLTPNIGITGPVPRLTPFEDSGDPFFLDAAGTRPDAIDDDQALWLRTKRGIVIMTGCCHAGLVNTINYIRHLTGNEKIRAIIGGFHLGSACDQRLEKTLHALQQASPDLLVPCHCTGNRATALFTEAFGHRVSMCHTGMEIALDGEDDAQPRC